MMASIKILLASLVIAAVMHCGSGQRNVSVYPHSCQFRQDFTKNAMKSMDTNYVKFRQPIIFGWDTSSWTTDYFCIMQSVLTVTPPPDAKAVLFSFNMFNPRKYSFHIGDTSTNDGEGGDSGTGGGFNAEIYGRNQTLYVYKRTENQVDPAALTKIEYFLNYPQVFLNIRITRENLIKFGSKGRSRNYKLELQGDKMFRFDEMYIGINRLVGDESKFGIGICGICIDFER